MEEAQQSRGVGVYGFLICCQPCRCLKHEHCPTNLLVDFILKEWLLTVSAAGFILTSIYAQHLPTYSAQEMEVLFILFTLFVVVSGLQQSGFIARISRQIENGKYVPLKLVLATFFLSMLLTNDVVLVVCAGL